jgi:hypothetical protein
MILTAPMAPVPAAAPHPPAHFGAISITAAVVCIAFAVLLRSRPLRRVEFLTPWLCLIAGIGLSAAFLSSWVGSIANLGKAIPIIGVATGTVIAVVLAYIVIYDLWPKHKSTNMTNASAIALPAFAPLIGGAVGALVASALGWVAVIAANAIAALFGIGG